MGSLGLTGNALVKNFKRKLHRDELSWRGHIADAQKAENETNSYQPPKWKREIISHANLEAA